MARAKGYLRLMGLSGVANPLADSLALELGDRSKDRQDELGDRVAGDIAVKIEAPQRQAFLTEG
jgi:hypothetical protein